MDDELRLMLKLLQIPSSGPFGRTQAIRLGQRVSDGVAPWLSTT